MKKYFFPALIAFSITANAQTPDGKASVVSAQMKEGKVVYERVRNLQIFAASPEMAERMPKAQTDRFELLFGNNQSLWQALPNVEDEARPDVKCRRAWWRTRVLCFQWEPMILCTTILKQAKELTNESCVQKTLL